jgi:hypothetical protein
LAAVVERVVACGFRRTVVVVVKLEFEGCRQMVAEVGIGTVRRSRRRQLTSKGGGGEAKARVEAEVGGMPEEEGKQRSAGEVRRHHRGGERG